MEAPMKNPAMIVPEAVSDGPPAGARSRTERIRTVAFWALTLITAWEMAAGSMWDLLRIDFVRGVMAHLGYPLYLLLIIGVWKLPCAATLLVPRFPRLKEWAYAGAFFNYTGAAASHMLAGEGAATWIGPLVFAGFTLGSWALRPADRRLPAAGPTATLRPVAWIVPIAILGAFLVLALLTLPKGAPPQ